MRRWTSDNDRGPHKAMRCWHVSLLKVYLHWHAWMSGPLFLKEFVFFMRTTAKEFWASNSVWRVGVLD